jgi:L,D-transpeptidase YcbB
VAQVVKNWIVTGAVALALAAPPVLAAKAKKEAPESILPPGMNEPATPDDSPAAPRPGTQPAPKPVVQALPAKPVAKPASRPVVTKPDSVGVTVVQSPQPAPPPTAPLTVQPLPAPLPAAIWSKPQAEALLATINGVAADGLIPADYQPDALAAAIAAGEGDAMNELATAQFRRLAMDLRDGRTPFSARIQWFVQDPDDKAMPTAKLLADALGEKGVAATLADLAPKHPDYVALRAALAATPVANTARRDLIRVNMERWRWLPQDLGFKYVWSNVPEMQLRFIVNNKLIRSYRSVVGSVKHATPQLAEQAQGVIFNPTWTVPMSIIKNEMPHFLNRAPGTSGVSGAYNWARSKSGGISVVQRAGPNNSLGLMKIDMPNAHAIFIHDTPARERFNQDYRALSHGCVRAERASELGITLAVLQGGIQPQEAADIIKQGKTTKVPFTETIPVYILYFTYATGLDGKLQSFGDLYGRDVAVVKSLASPRVERSEDDYQRAPVIAIEAPGI